MGSGLEGLGFSFEREWVGVSVYGNRSGFICFYTLWTRKTGDETAGGNRGRLVLSDVGSCFYLKDICIFSDTGFSADVLWLGNI